MFALAIRSGDYYMFDDDSDDDIMSSDGTLDYDDIQESRDNLYGDEGRLGPLQVRETNRLSWLPVMT